MFANLRKKELPFLLAFSTTLRSSSLFPCFKLISWRSRVGGLPAWTVWRGPRTRPFTFNWLRLSNFSSSPTGEKTEAQWGGLKCHGCAIFHKWEETREHLRVNVKKVRRSESKGTRLGRHSDVPRENIFWSSAFTCHSCMWTATYSTHSFRLPSKPFRHFGHM